MAEVQVMNAEDSPLIEGVDYAIWKYPATAKAMEHLTKLHEDADQIAIEIPRDKVRSAASEIRGWSTAGIKGACIIRGESGSELEPQLENDPDAYDRGSNGMLYRRARLSDGQRVMATGDPRKICPDPNCPCCKQPSAHQIPRGPNPPVQYDPEKHGHWWAKQPVKLSSETEAELKDWLAKNPRAGKIITIDDRPPIIVSVPGMSYSALCDAQVQWSNKSSYPVMLTNEEVKVHGYPKGFSIDEEHDGARFRIEAPTLEGLKEVYQWLSEKGK